MPKQTAEPLTAADIDALPTPQAPDDVPPGTIVGEGIAAERKPYTKEWYLDVEARKKDTSPDYRLESIIANETLDVSVNGVAFRLISGRKCFLPTPHYLVYMDRLNSLKELEEKYTPPPDGPKPMTVYRQAGVWQKTPIE